MTCRNIRKKANEIKKYGINDPFLLCRFLRIVLNYHNFDSGSGAIKGLYTRIAGVDLITLNADLPYSLQKVVLWHEIGHSVLHTRKTNFAELSLGSEADQYETEANLFAAEMMIENGDILALLGGRKTVNEIAGELFLPAEIIDFKLRMMKDEGIAFIDPPMTAKGNFLKDTAFRRI